MRFLLSIFALMLALMSHTAAWAAGKVALVIGNSAYVHANVLPNPVNDATDMTAALQGLGFTVIGGNDLDFASMGAKIGAFEDAARDADVTLFFYAGHGMQVNGRNYLMPVNAKLERESTLQFEAIDSETIYNAMSGPNKTAIALLDACRDNPLSRRFSRSMGTRSSAVGQGLAMPAITGGGLLIGFATAPGDTAADGDGRNSPFTTAMLKHINTPGLEIQSLMTRVKSDVYAATKEEQQPWHNSSLRTEYYMVPLEKTDAAPQIASTVDAEWNQVKETTSLAALDAFMAAHADKPMFMALAQERKDQLAKKNTSEVLDSLKIPERPVVKSQILKELVLNLPQDEAQPSVQKRSESDWTLAKFFDLGKTANDGGTKFALLSVPNVKLPRPGKNAGKKLGAFNMTEVASAQTLDLLLSSNTDITFSEEASTTCRLDWIDRCPFIPKPLIEMMGAAMLKNSMRIKDQLGPYFNISRLAGTENYILSNNPAFGNGDVAIVAAIVTPAGEVMDMFGFDLSRDRIGVETGDVASNVGLTWAAVEGDDIYVSFDSSYRCTDTPRKFGFITKFGMAERDVKWVSAFNVSDVNFVVLDSTLISANGGSCVDDFAYKISKDTGVIEARFKTPKAIERMDYNNGNLVLQLYEGAGVFQLP